MGYKVELTAYQDFLRFEVSGVRSVEATEKLYRLIARESAARHVYKILLVFHVTGRLSTFEIHDVVSKYRECGLGDRHKIAVFDEDRDMVPDQAFAEDVARVRGLDGAVFSTETGALAWLLGGEPGEPSNDEKRDTD